MRFFSFKNTKKNNYYRNNDGKEEKRGKDFLFLKGFLTKGLFCDYNRKVGLLEFLQDYQRITNTKSC